MEELLEYSKTNIQYMTYFIAQAIDGFLFNKILPKLFSRFGQKYKKIVFFIFCISVIGAHCAWYVNSKNPNLFELMEIDRTFTDEQLTKAYKLKTSSKNDIYFHTQYILKQVNRRTLYDLQLDLNIHNFIDGINVQLIFQISISYFLHLLILLSQLKEDGDHKPKKYIMLATIMIFLYEVQMILRYNNDNKDLMDYLFPRLTIYERGEIFKICTTPLLYSFNYYFKIFDMTIEEQVLQNQTMLRILNKKMDLRFCKNEDIKKKLQELNDDLVSNTNKFTKEAEIYKIHQQKMWVKYLEVKDKPQTNNELEEESKQIKIDSHYQEELIDSQNSHFSFERFLQQEKFNQQKDKEKNQKGKLNKLKDAIVYFVLIVIILNSNN